MGQGQEAHLEHDIATIPEADRPAWKKLDAWILAILWQSIDPQFMTIFRTFMTCHSTWTQAKSLFQGDITRAYDIIGNLFQLKQSETDNATHMGQFQSFATEFRDLLPFTSDARAYAKKMDELLVIIYLHTIRPDLDSVKSSILGSPTIPSLTEKSRSALLFSLHQLVMAEGDPLLPVEEEHLAQAEASNPTRAVDDICYDIVGYPSRPTAHIAASISSEDYALFLQFQAFQAQSSPSPGPSTSAALFTQSSSASPSWILNRSYD
ncbi:hypothetical protein AKJ16_DCAP18223, partial [Drosera capensis]